MYFMRITILILNSIQIVCLSFVEYEIVGFCTSSNNNNYNTVIVLVRENMDGRILLDYIIIN
jgi:hypothetical protein